MSTQVPAKKQEVVDLNKALIVRSPDGSVIRRIKQKQRLSEADGTMALIIKPKKAWKDRPAQAAVYIPTATGFKALSAKVGLAFDYPKTIIVDGQEQPNGYKDKEGTYYYVTRVGGFTSNGQPVIVQRLVDFNVRRYNLQDLLAKAKYKENTKYFKVLPYRGHDESGMLKGEPEDGDWAGYQVDEAVVLWVNCAAPEYISWLGEMNNRIKNAVRICQTFSERNAIAAHPAMPLKRKFATSEAVVPCTAWVAQKGTISMKELENNMEVEIDEAHISITEDEEQMAAVKADTAAEPLDQSDAVDVEADEIDEEEDDLDYTGNGAQDKQEPKEKAAAPDVAKEELVANILEMAKNYPTTFKKACEMNAVHPDQLAEAETTDLLEVKRLIQVKLDSVGRADGAGSEG